MDPKQTLKRILEQNEALDAIFTNHLGLDKSDSNPGYKAWATYAKDVGVRLVNLLIAASQPSAGRGLTGFLDLTFQLQSNEFWSKNANIFVPLLMAALNGLRDAGDLQDQRTLTQEYALYDQLLTTSRLCGLEMFPVLLLLAGGPALMAAHSLPLKTDLIPYLTT